MKLLSLFLLGLFSGLSSAQTSYVAPTRLLYENGHEFYIGADYFKTTHNVSAEGEKESLNSGESFDRIQVETGLLYGLAKNFQIGGGLRLRQNRSQFVRNINGVDEEFSATSSGLQSIFTTMSIGFEPVGGMSYALEGLFRYVPYSYSDRLNEPNFNFENDLILGDVGHVYSAGVAATYTTPGNNIFSARAGWRRPGTYLSPEIYWQGEAAMVWRTIALVAGVDGVNSMGNGQENRPFYNTATTNLYHGFEREWIAPYAGLNFTMGNHWRVELRARQVISGVSTDLGTAFGINLARRVETNPNRLADAKFKAYDVEVTVTKVSPKKNYVVIDKGLAEDIAKGMRLDFYEFDYVGGNVLVARGVVIQTKVDTSIVKITQHYNPRKGIKTGLIGRGQLK